MKKNLSSFTVFLLIVFVISIAISWKQIGRRSVDLTNNLTFEQKEIAVKLSKSSTFIARSLLVENMTDETNRYISTVPRSRKEQLIKLLKQTKEANFKKSKTEPFAIRDSLESIGFYTSSKLEEQYKQLAILSKQLLVEFPELKVIAKELRIKIYTLSDRLIDQSIDNKN